VTLGQHLLNDGSPVLLPEETSNASGDSDSTRREKNSR
jgi:hypothetical protein